MLQKAGGVFQLTADVDFGTTYGLKSTYYKSRTANVADAGQIRLARTDVVSFRNQANDANLDLAVDASNNLTFNGVSVVGTFTVDDTATIDLTLNAGELTADIVSGSITNAMVSASAAIAYSKLNLSGSIVNADINAGAAIVYSKLSLTGSIVNADISASAAIAYSKLDLANSIVSGDISGQISLAKGGTNKNMTAVAGGVVYTDADSMEVTSAGTSGQYFKSNGSSPPAFASFTPPTIQKFTSGSGTYTLPANVLYIQVEMVGGGGGGGGSGTAGGTAAGDGTSTTFGSATAGPGLKGAWSTAGGAGGTVTTAFTSIVEVGGANGGGYGQNAASGAAYIMGGAGASSYFGGAGAAGSAIGAGIAAKANSGSGGGGGGTALNIANSGGSGGGAGAYFRFQITSPAASYSYGVGSGGSAGGAGANGFAGGAGAAGQIIVYEFYQ